MRLSAIICFLALCCGTIAQNGIVDPGAICAGDSAIALTAMPTGGNWAGDVDSLGVFDTSGGPSGNPYLVTYSFLDTTGMVVVDSLLLTINPVPTVTADSAGPFCETSGTQQLTASPAGGVWGSFDGSTDTNGEFKPFFGAGNSPYTAWYTFTDSLGCSASDSIVIDVLAVPAVTLTAPGVLCPDDAPIQVTATPAAGVWLSGVDSTGVFDPGNASPGNYQVVYSFTDSISGCTNVGSIIIELRGYALPTGFSFSEICLNGGPDTLEAIGLIGGVLYSGAADPSGIVYPDSLGIGMHQVNYLTGCVSCCPYRDSLEITVIAPSDIQLLDSSLCADVDSALLLTNGSVDQWGGVADTDGYVFPSGLGVGVHQVTMIGSDAAGCPVVDSALISVLPRPTVVLTDNSPYCVGDPADTLQVSPSGGVWSGPIDSLGVFDHLDSAGIYYYSYSYTDPGSCTNVLEDSLVVLQGPSPMIDPIPGFCNTDPPFLMSAQPSGGLWSGGSTSTGIFDPGQALISGTIQVYYTLEDSVGCSDVDSASVVVLLEPEITFGMNGPYCQGTGQQILSALPGLGTWGGAANPDGTFDGNNEPGIYLVEYTVSNGLCTVTAVDTVVVDDCTSIEEYDISNWMVFPDPATDHLNIHVGPEPVHFDRMEIRDVSGRLTYHEYNGSVIRKRIDVSSWANGQYHLSIDGIPIRRFSVAR